MIKRKNEIGTQEYAVKDRWIVYRDSTRVIVNERVAIGPHAIGFINPMMIHGDTNTYIKQYVYTPAEFKEIFSE